MSEKQMYCHVFFFFFIDNQLFIVFTMIVFIHVETS